MDTASTKEHEEQSQASLPLTAHPATAALVGTGVVITLLMLPGSLILLLVALFQISVA